MYLDELFGLSTLFIFEGDGMNVQGSDCTLVVLKSHTEMSIPYSEETIREAVTLLEEYPSIEGHGKCKAIRTSSGAVGCIVTSLTISTAPLLLYLAFGETRYSMCISEIGNLYRHCIDLVPMTDTDPFGLLQDRGNEKKYYTACRVKSFELRILRDEAIKLKLDIESEKAPVSYPIQEQFKNERGERFRGENVKYQINDREYKNVYGVTLAVKKENGVKTELWIRRVLENENDIPETIDKLCITASLLRDRYDEGHFGKLRITLKSLVLAHDETSVECDDSVIGPLRYFVNGEVIAETFTTGEGSFV
jgi:hypothetical protein